MAGSRTQMYTIEQIELIRRLRNSGLTKEQIIQAYDSFERVDAEFGNLYNVPDFTNIAQRVTNGLATPSVSNPSTTHSIGHRRWQFHGPTRKAKEPRLELSESPGSCNSQDGMQASAPEDGQEMKTESPNDLDNDTKDVDEFLKKKPEVLQSEIQEYFLANPTLAHSDVALAAGVSIACVSKFHIGNFAALMTHELRSLAKWFLGENGAISTTSVSSQHASASSQLVSSQQAVSTQASLTQASPQILRQPNLSPASRFIRDVIQERLQSGSSGGFGSSSGGHMGVDYKDYKDISLSQSSEPEGLAVNFAPRRERFTFRKEHLEVLENYFKKNQYPSYDERLEISQRCNDIMLITWNRNLNEKERMSHQNVAYWFSNRRKDIKRLAKEGGIDTTEVILPSKINKTPSLESEAAFYSPWPAETVNSSTYSPLQAPLVGPIAFPGFRQRMLGGMGDSASISDMGDASSNSQDAQSLDEGTSEHFLSSGYLLNSGVNENGAFNSDTHINQVAKSSSHTLGSALARISAQLLRKTEALSGTVGADAKDNSQAKNEESNSGTDSAAPLVVKLEPQDQSECT